MHVQEPESIDYHTGLRIRNKPDVGGVCNRESTIKPWLFVDHVSSKEIGWLTKACSESKSSKLVPQAEKISIDKRAEGATFPTNKRLYDEIGFTPGVLPYTDFRIASPLSQVHFQRHNLSNDLLAVRYRKRPKNVRNSFQLGCTEAQRKRHQNSGVPGRLPHGKPMPLHTRRTHERGHQPAHQSRMDNKQKEVVDSTISRNRVSRNSLEYPLKRKISAKKKDCNTVQTLDSNSRGKNIDFASTTKSNWYPTVCQLRGTFRNNTLQKSSVVPSSSSETEKSCAADARRQRGHKLVDAEHPHGEQDLGRFRVLSHCDGRVRCRLGSICQRCSYSGFLDARGTSLSCEYERVTSNLQGIDTRQHHHRMPQQDNFNSKRQSNSSSILTQTGGNTFGKPVPADAIDLQANRGLQHQPRYQLSAGSSQQCSRRSIQMQGVSRMASHTTSLPTDIQQMGDTRCGPDGIQTSPCRAQVCVSRPDGSECVLPRRIQSDLETQVGLDLPTTMSDVQGPSITEPSPRDFHRNMSEMEQCLLESRSQETSSEPAIHNLGFGISVDRHKDQSAAGTSKRPSIGGMEMSGWGDLLGDWSSSEISIIESSWRPSTLKTYRQAWTRWLKWCKNSGVNNKNPGGQGVSKYLIYLHNVEGLSYKTILVHKSVVSSFCQPDLETKLSAHILVRQALRGIANKCAHKKRTKLSVWNPQVVIQWLLRSEPHFGSLFEVSRRCATLLLLASGRRVHDLTLLSIKEGECIIDEGIITFWPLYGSKTDTINHRQSGWQLLSGDDQNIDPVFWIKKLLEVSQSRRASGKNNQRLFITTRGEPKPASRTIIGGWIKTVLVEAGIHDPPGSIRSAVASLNWVNDMPLKDILARGNWSTPNTLIRFYRRPVRDTLLPDVPSLSGIFTPL